MRQSRMTRVLAASIATSCGMLPTIAPATPNVATDSAVFVERVQSETSRQLEPAERLNRGDRIVTIVTWYRHGGQGAFTITNPLPGSVSYQKSARGDEQVSVDGGKAWGRLADLKVGSRNATPEDVTHVRWRISAQNAQSGRGHIAYSGIVR
ncbi:MAG: hypothetical protein P8J20_06605 [Novosphingobium sp.]|nr:hypothetical protein [Novosphingobium sp.]